MATLRRLALSVLFTIATTSYQTTCTVSERTFNKRQHANARYRVESLTRYALRHGGSSDTALKEEYHLSEVFDVRRFVQIETSRDGGNLTWEKLVEEAKRQECVGKEYAKFRRENSGGGTPSYGDPALAADAVSRGYKPQPRSRTPSGGKGGKSQKQCDRCGRRNGCTGEKGTCPAWGKECGIYRGKNHYKAVCRKAAQIQAGGGAQPKFQKQGKGKSPGKNGKAKAKHAHSVVFKTVPSAKGTVS